MPAASALTLARPLNKGRTLKDARSARLLGLFLGLSACATASRGAEGRPPPAPLEQTGISVIDLQPGRSSSVILAKDLDGTLATVTLTNLNPRINGWFLLTLDWGREGRQEVHLENLAPLRALSIARGTLAGIAFKFSDASAPCELSLSHRGDGRSSLAEAVRSGLPYAPLCGGRLLVRNQVAGHSSTLEKVSDFLRDHTFGGDALISLVKKQMYQDAFLEPGRLSNSTAVAGTSGTTGPLSASVDLNAPSVAPTHLGLTLSSAPGSLQEGRWYLIKDNRAIYFSVLSPQAIAKELQAKHEPHLNGLSAVEASALVYLVAFDLSHFNLHFELGTDHPRLGWSGRVLPKMREQTLPGPDGISSRAPLIATGMVSPELHDATVAAFTAGFKRQHGAFHYGEFAAKNHGSHYGFVEQGVIFSRLQPGLATVYTLADGSIHMGTWPEEPPDWSSSVRDARQNGVPLVESGPSGESVPGALVNDWGAGNWSGSQDEDLRSLRAGLCLQESGGQRFLVFAYFSSATPSAMARVFQAYHCHYAMHLDMNALEHTYLALYSKAPTGVEVEHLIEGMGALDPKVEGHPVPRFLEAPDDRDFFYLTRKATR